MPIVTAKGVYDKTFMSEEVMKHMRNDLHMIDPWMLSR